MISHKVFMKAKGIKQLYLAKNYIEANIIKSILSDINIDSYLFGNNLQIGIGGLPIDSTFTKIFVSKKNYVSAKKFIKEYKKNLLKQDLGMKVCKNCQEISPITLTACWHCGQDSIKK